MGDKGTNTLREIFENEDLRRRYLTPPVIGKNLGKATHMPTEHLKQIVENTKQNWAQRHWVWWAIISAIIGAVITKGIDHALIVLQEALPY